MDFKLNCSPVGASYWAKNGVTVNQLFGENLNPAYKDNLGLQGHNGIDLNTHYYQDGKAPVFAAHDGWVVSDKTIQSDTKGRFVEIMTDEVTIDGKLCKVKTVYFHLSEARVSVTDDVQAPWFWPFPGKRKIKAGILIGYAGNTGQYTTGAHLHFGMTIYWKKSEGTYFSDLENGERGTVDPMPYFNDNTIYQYGSRNFYNGKEIDSATAHKLIIPKFI